MPDVRTVGLFENFLTHPLFLVMLAITAAGYGLAHWKCRDEPSLRAFVVFVFVVLCPGALLATDPSRENFIALSEAGYRFIDNTTLVARGDRFCQPETYLYTNESYARVATFEASGRVFCQPKPEHAYEIDVSYLTDAYLRNPLSIREVVENPGF